jgi:proline iminopeptidase
MIKAASGLLILLWSSFLFGASKNNFTGSILDVSGVKIWYRQAGKSSSIPTIYLHGGPGYNSYAFERSSGPLLEKQLQMVYVDQRGGGRSPVADSSQLGINNLRDDVELIRLKLKASKINLIAHSFGGLVALEYLKKYQDHVHKIILVDISADLAAAFDNQIKEYLEIAKKLKISKIKDIEAALASTEPVSTRLMKVFEFLPVKNAHRHLLYATAQGQEKNDGWDKESKLSGSDLLWSRLAKDGYLDSSHGELMRPIPIKATLFAGVHSKCIGKKNIEAAAAAWKVPIVWFENSGHFIYIEEPQLFAAKAISFLVD